MENFKNNYSHKNKNQKYKKRYKKYRRAKYDNDNNWNFNIEILSLDDIKTRQLLDDKVYQDYLRKMNSKAGADNE